MSSVLVVKELKHSYDDGQHLTQVLKGVNVEFRGGKIYAILGESGSGKTTLISLIAGLDRVQSGKIEFNGTSIKSIGVNEWRLKYVNIVFQAFNLIKYMTARENVEVALDFAKFDGDEKERAYELLGEVGISRKKADKLVMKLSGGEQQRVAVARAMAGDDPIIVADEPTGNLDEDNEVKVLELFKKLAMAGKIVIIVTHSQRVAKSSGAVVRRMKDGMLK
jgi:putative ABC transport system ATP-binding protein